MKVRNSSIEVYRILATFSVLIAHFNGWFLGGIEPFDVNDISPFRIGQLSIASICACCVNCFLLISGYFGIKLRFQSISKLLIQLLGIFLPLYVLFSLILGQNITVKMLIYNSLPLTRGGYFVQCYFMLMLISPILNAYIEKYEKRTVLYLVLVFVALEMWFDCILNNNRFGFTQGYSVLHFCVIYVIGRLIALYKDILLRYIKLWKWILLFCGCCIVISLMHVWGLPFTFNYSNPVVILSAICSFIPFLYFEFTNRAINWIAGGSFAVYIIQIVDPIFRLLCDFDKSLLSNNPYMLYLIKGLTFCVLFFLLCVLYDKLREFLSRGLVKRINNIYERYF